MRREIVFLILLSLIVAVQVIPSAQASSSALLQTWYYLGMKPELQNYLNLGSGDKVCQGFKPPGSWTVDEISVYAECKLKGKRKLYVELHEDGPEGTVLASGSVYVSRLKWYDVQLSGQVALSPDKWYFIVAYANNSWNIYYHNDGKPNDDGLAGVKRYNRAWEFLLIDLLTRYHAMFTVDSTRLQQLKTLAETYKPTLQFEAGMIYFPCDFYYDNDTNVDNNRDNYPGNTESKLQLIRVFMHIEEYSFSDQDGVGPAIAIEYWFYYVYNIYYPWWGGTYEHYHDWEAHLIVFLNQYDTSNVVLLKTGAHGRLYSHSWGEAEKEGSHAKVYIAHDSHAADIDTAIPSEIRWDGNGVPIRYDDSRYKEIYVRNSRPCEGESVFNGKVYCKITSWEGEHVYWDDFSGYWWAKEYGNITTAWHKDAWDEPGVTSY